MNYRTRKLTLAAAIRIALRLAASTGINRLVWVNRKGRVFIIAEGIGGYWHSSNGLQGHTPGLKHIGVIVECFRCKAQ